MGAIGGDDVASIDPRLVAPRERSEVAPRPGATATASVSRRSSVPGNDSKCDRRTVSRWSCGTHAGEVGLNTALCASVGYPTSTACPRRRRRATRTRASGTRRRRRRRGPRPRAPTTAASPSLRKLTTVARGSDEQRRRGARRRGTRRPSRASVIAAVSPAGPAPTMTTRSARSSSSSTHFHETCCSFKRQFVVRHYGLSTEICETVRRGDAQVRATAPGRERRRDAAAHPRRGLRSGCATRRPSRSASTRSPRLAKVARSTIYLVFGSRAGLFDAFTEDLWARTGLARAHRSGRRTPTPAQHLRGGVAAACRMYAADRDIYRVLYSMAQLDPDSVGGAVRKMNKERIGGMDHLARRLAEDGCCARRHRRGRHRTCSGCSSASRASISYHRSRSERRRHDRPHHRNR